VTLTHLPSLLESFLINTTMRVLLTPSTTLHDVYRLSPLARLLSFPLPPHEYASTIIIHLLGRAPAGFSTAPYEGPKARALGGTVGTPLRRCR
jgi:hypothetical protein